jgi:2-dehydro-3-deoxygluconokinase
MKKVEQRSLLFSIGNDDLSDFKPSTFVTFGETMIRETPADLERPERTRKVYLSMAGSEYSLAIGLSRLGIPVEYITRVPDNPYGRAVRNIARENGVKTCNFVWAPKAEPIGRMIYEIGRTPRKNKVVYQRMYSAASKLDSGMVDWRAVLKHAKLFHTTGITFGLAYHSQYGRNYNYEAFKEAMSARPAHCLMGLDFNYRSTLWTPEQVRKVMSPILSEHIDILTTSIGDMARFYGIDCGQYTADQVVNDDVGQLEDEDIRAFANKVIEIFKVKIVAITIRYPETFEQHRWESAAMDSDGNFFRSPAHNPITLQDRLGGGDAWSAGFYYGLLTAGFNANGITKGVLVGDATTRVKQTLMFDLPIIDKEEIDSLLKADAFGGGMRVSR